MFRSLSAGFVGACLATTGCFETERTRDFGEGEVRLVVTDESGAPIEGAVVAAIGTERMARSDATGLAVVRGLAAGDYALSISVDDDADGIADAATIRGDATVRRAEVRGLERLTAFELGPVVLGDVGNVSGTVTGCGATELCRVVAFRHIALGSSLSREIRDVALPVESASGVAVDGSWLVAGLAQGTVTLLATAWEKSAVTEPTAQLLAASRPSRFVAVDVTVGDTGVTIDLASAAPVPASVSATFELMADPTTFTDLSGEANYFVPNNGPDITVGLRGVFAGLSTDAPTAVIEMPISLFDLNVQVNGLSRRVANVVAVPDIGALLPVVLDLPEACPTIDNVDGAFDCDGDGVVDSDDADVDGDGVDDVNEPAGCVGVGRGIDDDGDCLCGVVDPFPGCASNDPLDCARATPAVCD